jgi:hypothetical protein
LAGYKAVVAPVGCGPREEGWKAPSENPVYAEAPNIGPVPSGSGPYTPDQSRYDDDFSRQLGATYRELFDLLPLWEQGQYFPLAFSRKKVEEVTEHRLVLEPAE